ncbi:MAG TPA: alpha/beta hydrolase [Blastocatellia bacterium]|nr:alpha/beta hydrolase [Blastocatellia bacterium]
MKRISSSLILFASLLVASPTFAQKLADPILLWPNGAPGATGNSDEDKPAIIPVLPAEANNTGAAILVIPGGGFTLRATDHEGVLVANWLKERGIAAFVLRYRIRPLYERKDWLADAQRALQYIRANAKQYRLSPTRIGTVGFSAGANLAADLSFNPLLANPEASDPLERVSSRPDFLILSYGSMQMPANIAAANVPPTFMYCTQEDAGQARGMLDLYSALLKAKVPAEAHFFVSGVHGVGFAQGDPILGEWPNLMHRWLRAGGFLTDKSRLPVAGVVKLDGTPLLRGMVMLTPVDQPNAPAATIYITNAHTDALGSFALNPAQGLVAGKYRVEVRQDATRWLSNSRDPVMIGMMEKLRNRTLTDEDRKQWSEYVRKRDQSPSIENQRIFRRQRPNDKNDYIIEIKNGGENKLNLEVFSR